MINKTTIINKNNFYIIEKALAKMIQISFSKLTKCSDFLCLIIIYYNL